MKPVSSKQNIVVQELDKELLVYDLSTNKAYVLNESSALVYQLSDGKKTIQEISYLMSVNLKTLVSEDFVWLALNELKRDGLLENTEEMKEYFARISRRDLVNKVALASLLALPIIVSVTSPTAAQTRSCGPLNGACINALQTQSNCCENLRCFASTCIDCVPSGQPLVACLSIGGCGNCDTAVQKNRCCNTTGFVTDNGANCICP